MSLPETIPDSLAARLAVRVSLLATVRQQIDITLHQVGEAAVRHAAAGVDNSALTPVAAQLHQVTGALRMVQYPGAGRFCAEIETALRAALRSVPADKAEIEIIARATQRLREFVNEVTAGGAYQPAQLFPLYREVAKVGGNDAPSEKDLFFPEIIDNAPAHSNPRPITPAILPVLVKDLRVRYQRGLLAWLKDSAKPDGLKLMRDVLDALHQIAAQVPEPRGVWWASVGLTEAVMELLPDPKAAEWLARVKPVFSRIDFLLRDLANTGTANTAPAQRDVYYAIASCRQATPRVREAQQLLNLRNVVIDTPATDHTTHSHQPQLDDITARLTNIKEVWTEYVAGEPKRLDRYRELLTPLTQKAQELGNAPLLQLLTAISGATQQLPDPYPLDGQVMSLEMASALLMAESIVQHFNNLPADLDGQVAIMTGWLAEAVAGKIASNTPAGLRADIVQKANDEKLRIATAREILKSLQQVEKAVEAYATAATDPAKRAALTPLSGTLRQVHGVFAISNQKRAARLANACRVLLERCAATTDANAQHHIEWLAEGLGSLGFYLEPCLHGKEPAERAINLFFTRYENQPGFEDLLAQSQRIVVPPPAPSAAAPDAPAPAPTPTPTSTSTSTPTPAPAPLPIAPAVDREMLEVFLEEANEVLTAMESNIAQARANTGDHDALINMRRAFHTLKGSARMVGLPAFGECGWELEQVMNHCLAQGHATTPQLMDLCADARDLLAEWAHALQGDDAPAIDASGIAQRARAQRGEPPLAAVAPPAADLLSLNLPMGNTAATPAFMSVAIPAEGSQPPAAAALASAAEAPPTSVVPAEPASPTPSPADAPLYEFTLADMGDRLLWLNGLVDEIQEQAAAGSKGTERLMEIAHMMAESMTEALTLHRTLKDQLQAQKKPADA